MHNSGGQDERILIDTILDNIQVPVSHYSMMAPSRQDQQLFTVHGVALGYTMPLIHAITEKTRSHLHIFAQEWNHINPSLCMLDFEIANMNAVWLLPNAGTENETNFASKWQWKVTPVTTSVLPGLPFVSLKDVNKNSVHCRECGSKFRWPNRLCWERCDRGNRPEASRFLPETWMYTYQYWRLTIGQTIQWKGGIANFKAYDSVLSFNLKFIKVLKDKHQSYKVTSQVFGDHTQI